MQYALKAFEARSSNLITQHKTIRWTIA